MEKHKTGSENSSVQLKTRVSTLKKHQDTHTKKESLMHTRKSYSVNQKPNCSLEEAPKRKSGNGKRMNEYCKRTRLIRCISISMMIMATVFGGVSIFFAIFPPWWTPLIPVKTEGLKAVISTAGMVCFALTYINTAKPRDMKGFLFDDVVSFHFPHYGIIFGLHAIFVLLGIYFSYEGNATTVAFCAIAVFLCVVYATMMAYFAIFSEKRKSSLVKKYIEEKKSPSVSKEEKMQVIFSLGKYIFNSHKDKLSTTSVLQIYDNYNENAASFLRKDIRLLMEMTANTLVIPSRNKKGILDEFEMLFPEKAVNDSVAGFLENMDIVQKYPYECSIIFNIPAYEKEINDFNNDMLNCCRMWESLLSNSNDINTHAAIIYTILNENYDYKGIKNSHICCSLLLYMKANLVHSKNDYSSNGWQELMLRLYHSEWLDSRMSARCYRKNEEKAKNSIQGLFKDLSITTLALAVLEQISTDKIIPLNIVHQMLNTSPWREDWQCNAFLSEKDALRYLSFATIIQRAITAPEIVKISPPEMYLSLPKMLQIITEWINGERDYEATNRERE